VKPKDIRELTDEELGQRLDETREAYFNLRFQSASGALEQTSELKNRRREIARLLTIAHERELS
jgi:large subunit ribosomal protein L29